MSLIEGHGFAQDDSGSGCRGCQDIPTRHIQHLPSPAIEWIVPSGGQVMNKASTTGDTEAAAGLFADARGNFSEAVPIA
jgi:hypothetical protein